MPFSGCAPFAFHARARYRTLSLAMFCMACAWPVSAASSASADVPALVADLRHPEAQKRDQAAAGLIAAGPAAVPALVAAIKGERNRGLVMKILHKIGPKAVPELIALLGSPELRNRAGAALFQVIGPESSGQTKALLECLHDPEVNNYCGTALIKAMGPQAKGQLPRLIAALKDSDKTVRLYAAAALGQIGPQAKAAVPGLIAALQDPEPAVRMSAVSALGRIGRGAKEAVPALKAMKRGQNDEVKNAIAEALKNIHG